MKVLVLGAGVVGLTTAYHLWKDGHEVVVVDTQAGPGRETSYGNAGGLCPSFAGPWAAPGMVAKVLGMSLQADSPIRFSLMPNWQRMRWVMQWMQNCNAEKFRINKLRMQRVAHYSYACLKEIATEAPITDFDFCQGGVLQIFRTQAELDLGRLSAKTLEEYGVNWKLLAPEDVRKVEPALAQSTVPITGALLMPADASGDSFKFANQLAAFLEARGVSFMYGTSVTAIHTEGDGVSGIMTKAGPMKAEAYVVALGNHAPMLVAPLGIRLPVYPLKGYSITVPVRDRDATTQAALMDEHNKVMISRLGDRIRAAGMAELTGYSTGLKPERKALLVRVVRELLPRGLDFDNVEFWAGLRPMTPDGPPILGKTRWRNLWLNSGHGSNGWTQSCGTGKIVADLVHGRTPGIDMDGLTLARFGN
ncbi:MAG: D-amino acid dehydrogenase [Pseudomonadota bacterium]